MISLGATKSVRERVAELAETGIPIVPVVEVDQAAARRGFRPTGRRRSRRTTATRSCRGRKRAIGAVAVFALWFTGDFLDGLHPHTRPKQSRPLGDLATPMPRLSRLTGDHHRCRGARVIATRTGE